MIVWHTEQRQGSGWGSVGGKLGKVAGVPD